MSNEFSRRQVLMMSALAAAAFTPIGKAFGASAPGTSSVDAGSLSDYAKDGVYNQFAAQGFFVIRKDGKIFAQSSMCTHKRGKLTPTADGFFCKSHNSTFALDGTVTRPPAKAGLARYGVQLDGKKHLVVNTSKRIEHTEFDTPGAYVEAPAS